MSSTTQPTTFSDLRCAVDNCERSDLEHGGLCMKHYAYNLRHGHPQPMGWATERLALSPRDAAWLAAVLDCEGTIGISRRSDGVGRYFTFVSVGNTNPLLIERISALVPGGRTRFIPRQGRAKDVFEWKVSRAERVRALLLAISDDLILKREQARIVLEEWPPLHAKAGLERAAAHAKVAALNRKGKP